MEWDIAKMLAVVAAGLGINEWRLRWIKREQEVVTDKMDVMTRDIDRHYMTKEDTHNTYKLLNAVTEERLKAIDRRQQEFDKKLDMIIDLVSK